MSQNTPHNPLTNEAAPKRSRRKEAPRRIAGSGAGSVRGKRLCRHAGGRCRCACRVSKGTLFLYFPSKEELFKAVVRENIVGRFAEWNNALESFVGTTSEVLTYCYQVWWERIGATKASGITKLMFSEAQNFPELRSSTSKR